MAKKFIPDAELLNTIITRYKETKNYSQVARETGLSVVVIKRILSENNEAAAQSATEEKISVEPQKSAAAKPKTAAQIVAARVKYSYVGPAPLETSLPTKAVYYGQLVELARNYLNV